MSERLSILAILIALATLIITEIVAVAIERRARRRTREEITRFWRSVFYRWKQ